MEKIWHGAFICVFNRDFSKILLLRRNEQKRKKSNSEWGNVGGSIEPGETPVQACIREAREETGVHLNSDDLFPILDKRLPQSKRYHHESVMHFYATSIDENTKISLNDESDTYEWFGPENLPDKTLDPKKDIMELWEIAKKKRLGQ